MTRFAFLAFLALGACAPAMPAMPTNLTVFGSGNTVTITTMTSTMGSLTVPLSGAP